MTGKPRVYIAGPYSSDPEANTRCAVEAFHALLDAGFAPFCPHFTHYAELVRSRPYEEWLAYDLEWLETCAAVLRLPGDSPGADRECARARELGISVFGSLSELIAWKGTLPTLWVVKPAPEPIWTGSGYRWPQEATPI